MRAKTTDKGTHSVSKKHWAFRASKAGVVIGSDKACGISILDSNLGGSHARIFLNDEGSVTLESNGRVYLLIGQGARSNGPVTLEKDQVVKMGACSMMVADTCVERKLPLAPAAAARYVPHACVVCCCCRCAVTCCNWSGWVGSVSCHSRASHLLFLAVSRNLCSPLRCCCVVCSLLHVCIVFVSHPFPCVCASPSCCRGAGATDCMCYICFDDTSEPENLLVSSPCVCGKLVHRLCLQRWIATKGSRLCSICKGKLPIDYTMDPPYVVLQVVRHMRGLHWSGRWLQAHSEHAHTHTHREHTHARALCTNRVVGDRPTL